MHFSGLESFNLPNGKQFLIIFINSLIGSMISDLFQNYSNVLLSPHVVSFGLTLTIPISYFYDVLEKKVNFDYRYIIVSVLIIIAFSFIIYEKLTKNKVKV
jgi:drug/metabolite transporter (DMT)-like permease